MANEKRLIDANAVLAGIETFMQCYAEKEKELTPFWVKVAIQALEMVRQLIKEMPTVDAVEVKCKVGNLVYALWEAPVKQKYIIYFAEVKEIRIGMRNCRLTTTYRLEPIMYRGHIHEYRDDCFGKLVFLTEEEAEAALAKMDGDGNG